MDPSMGRSIGNTPLPIASWPGQSSYQRMNEESGRNGLFEGYGRRKERRKESPEGSVVAQLSHLPIGPSHVLICLLVNPASLLSFISFLAFRGTLSSPSFNVRLLLLLLLLSSAFPRPRNRGTDRFDSRLPASATAARRSTMKQLSDRRGNWPRNPTSGPRDTAEFRAPSMGF